MRYIKEKQLLADNYEKVVDSNNDFTKVILKIGGFCFFMLFYYVYVYTIILQSENCIF